LQRDFFHFRHAARLEFLKQQRSFFGTERLQLQHVQNCGGIFLQKFFAQRIVTGLQNFVQVFHHAIANTGELFQLVGFLGKLFDGFWQSRNKFGGLFVTAIAADDCPVNFQQLCSLAKDAGDLLVVHGVIIMRTGFESSVVT